MNNSGKSQYCAIKQPVKVQEFAGGSKPEFVRKIFNKNTNLKGQVTFECEAIMVMEFSNSYSHQYGIPMKLITRVWSVIL